MAINIDKMREKLETLENGDRGGSSTDFRPEEGDQNIRFLPAEDGDPFKEFYVHYNLGKGKPGVLCAKKNFGESCPICELATKLWREGVDTDDDTIKKYAKDLFPKARYASHIVVRGKENEGPKIYNYSKTVYKQLIDLVLDPDYGDITDIETGLDLKLTYTKPTKKGEFPQTSITPRRKSSHLVDSGDIEDANELIEKSPSFDKKYPKVPFAELKTLVSEYVSEVLEAEADDEVVEELSTETKKYSNSDEVSDSDISAVDAAIAELKAKMD